MKKTEYLVRVVYKSGYFHEFWCSDFEYERDTKGNLSANWTGAESNSRPIYLNVDDISSIWLQGERVVEVGA